MVQLSAEWPIDLHKTDIVLAVITLSANKNLLLLCSFFVALKKAFLAWIVLIFWNPWKDPMEASKNNIGKKFGIW